MIQELISTSAQRCLNGNAGFGIVAQTVGMAPNVSQVVNALSGYTHVATPGDSQNPVVYLHAVRRTGGMARHIISRVADCGDDYSGRSNRIAHHWIIEATDVGSLPGGPAALITQDIFRTHWNEKPTELPPRQLSAPEGSLNQCSTWEQLTGDAGWGKVVAASAEKGTPVSIVFPPDYSSEHLRALISEALALLPFHVQWRITFSTYFMKSQEATGDKIQIKCLLASSEAAQFVKQSPDTLVIDLREPLGAAPAVQLMSTSPSHRGGHVQKMIKLPSKAVVQDDDWLEIPTTSTAPAPVAVPIKQSWIDKVREDWKFCLASGIAVVMCVACVWLCAQYTRLSHKITQLSGGVLGLLESDSISEPEERESVLIEKLLNIINKNITTENMIKAIEADEDFGENFVKFLEKFIGDSFVQSLIENLTPPTQVPETTEGGTNPAPPAVREMKEGTAVTSLLRLWIKIRVFQQTIREEKNNALREQSAHQELLERWNGVEQRIEDLMEQMGSLIDFDQEVQKWGDNLADFGSKSQELIKHMTTLWEKDCTEMKTLIGKLQQNVRTQREPIIWEGLARRRNEIDKIVPVIPLEYDKIFQELQSRHGTGEYIEELRELLKRGKRMQYVSYLTDNSVLAGNRSITLALKEATRYEWDAERVDETGVTNPGLVSKEDDKERYWTFFWHSANSGNEDIPFADIHFGDNAMQFRWHPSSPPESVKPEDWNDIRNRILLSKLKIDIDDVVPLEVVLWEPIKGNRTDRWVVFGQNEISRVRFGEFIFPNTQNTQRGTLTSLPNWQSFSNALTALLQKRLLLDNASALTSFLRTISFDAPSNETELSPLLLIKQ